MTGLPAGGIGSAVALDDSGVCVMQTQFALGGTARRQMSEYRFKLETGTGSHASAAVVLSNSEF